MIITEEEKEQAYQLSKLKYELDLQNDLTEAWEDGKRKGMLEAKLEIARNMNKRGVSIRRIAEYTGISLEDISELYEHYFFANQRPRMSRLLI
jgi:predicted transposase/invertase (TIGR01784 family)